VPVKRGLGRGLAALIPELDVAAGEASAEVSLDALKPNPAQPRRDFPPEALASLADSIATQGVIQPLVVRRAAAGGEIVPGERRFRAARLAGLATVPVVVRQIDDRRLLEIALVENLQREDLNPIDEALALAQLEQVAGGQEAVARQVGRSRSAVANAIRLLQLTPDVLELVRSGVLSAGHGRALVTLPPGRQRKLAADVRKRALSVRQTEALAAAPSRPSSHARPTLVQALERQVADHLGLPVRIAGDVRRGRLTVTYRSRAELEQLLVQLGSAWPGDD